MDVDACDKKDIVSPGRRARFSKSSVHEYFELVECATGAMRWKCLVCLSLCFAERTGTSRKIGHIVGLTSLGKRKKVCFPCGAEKKALQQRIIAKLVEEQKIHNNVVANGKRKQEARAKLEAKRAKSSVVITEKTPAGKQFGKDATVSKADVDAAWARFVYGEGVKPSKFDSPFFKIALRKSIRFGMLYSPPNSHKLAGPLLDNTVERLRTTVLDPLIDTIRVFGCTLVSDGWSNLKRTPLLNTLLFTSDGVYFHKTFGTNGATKSKAWIAEFIVGVIRSLPFAESKVISVVMDGANRHSFEAIEKAIPGLECQWCSTHVLNLLLKDFSDVAFFQEVSLLSFHCFVFLIFLIFSCVLQVTDAVKEAVTFIYNHQKTLFLFRANNETELATWCHTRFGTVYLTCASVVKEERALMAMIVDPEFDKWARKKEYTEIAARMKKTFLKSTFWVKLKIVVQVTEKVFKVLRALDSDMPSMPWVYYWMHQLVAGMKKFKPVPGVLTKRHVQVLVKMTKDRWEHMYAHIHGAGFLLNPFVMYSGYHATCDEFNRTQAKKSLKRFIEGFIQSVGDKNAKGAKARRDCHASYVAYVNKKGEFRHVDAQEAAKDKQTINPAEWWQMYGEDHEILQNTAMQILSQTTSASPCERNWSAQKFVQSSSESLKPKNLEKRVYTYANIRLERKMASRWLHEDATWDDPLSSASISDESSDNDA